MNMSTFGQYFMILSISFAACGTLGVVFYRPIVFDSVEF
jgi:hypothetical protein